MVCGVISTIFYRFPLGVPTMVDFVHLLVYKRAIGFGAAGLSTHVSECRFI